MKNTLLTAAFAALTLTLSPAAIAQDVDLQSAEDMAPITTTLENDEELAPGEESSVLPDEPATQPGIEDEPEYTESAIDPEAEADETFAEEYEDATDDLVTP